MKTYWKYQIEFVMCSLLYVRRLIQRYSFKCMCVII